MTTILSTTQKRIAGFVMGVALLFGGFASVVPQAKAQVMSVEQMQTQIAQLLQVLMNLQKQFSAMQTGSTSDLEGGFTSQGITEGSEVVTMATLRVRAGASTEASLIKDIAANTRGTVVDGPRYGNGYTWWLVQYSNGTKGWSAENWLQKKAKVTSSSEKSGYKMYTNDNVQAMPGEVVKVAQLTLPSDRYGSRYLNQGNVAVVSPVAPWELIDDIIVSTGRRSFTIDATNSADWDHKYISGLGEKAYVFNLYDKAEHRGWGAILFRIENVTISLSIGSHVDQEVEMKLAIPEDGIELWERNSGTVMLGDSKQSVVVKVIKSLPSKENEAPLQDKINDLLDQVDAVNSQSPTDDEVDPPGYNAFACNKTQRQKYGDGSVACYGMWDYGQSFGGDEDMCGMYSDGTTDCEVSASVCSSGVAVATDYYSNSQLKRKSSNALKYIARNLDTNVATVKEEVAGLWVYQCRSDEGVMTEGASDNVLESVYQAHVKDIYQIVLGREPDADGLAYWVDLLLSEDRTVNDLYINFYMSAEYQAKGKSDEAFITDVYAAAAWELSDEVKADWLEKLRRGTYDRHDVLEEIIYSDQFKSGKG